MRELGTIRTRDRLALLAAAVAVFAVALTLAGADRSARLPGPGDRCPVCGMYVAKYPDWTACVEFRDGERAYFDGPKDLFKYLFHLDRYTDSKTRDDVTSIRVTEYYALATVDASAAFFVEGSDVYGPMGRELVPCASADEAREFAADHGGKRILRLDEITPQLIEEMD